MVSIHCFLNNFVIIVDIEPWLRLPCWRHLITSGWRVFECVDAQEATGLSKTSDWSKTDCSVHERCRKRYLVYYESYRDEILQEEYEMRLRLLTRFEQSTVRKTEYMADRKI